MSNAFLEIILHFTILSPQTQELQMDVPLVNTTAKCSLYSYAFIMIISELVYKVLKMRNFLYIMINHIRRPQWKFTLYNASWFYVYEKQTSGRSVERI